MDYLYKPSKKIIPIICIPWILATMMYYDPVSSYFIAWTGTFFIFFISIGSSLSYHQRDLPINQQVMRPIVLIQLVFAGFMCSTSIFYFMDHLGYQYLNDVSNATFEANEQTRTIAKCQRLALLAHTAIVTGIIISTRKTTPAFKFIPAIGTTSLLIYTGACSFLISQGMSFLPAIIQFKQPMLNISISCSALLLITGIAHRHPRAFIPGAVTFLFNLSWSLFTGYKENILLNFILIAAMAYPYYKKTVIFLSLPALYLLIYLLPVFTAVIRKESWTNRKNKVAAGKAAYQLFTDEEQDEKITLDNWEFLRNRFSEIGMFSTYVRQTPDEQPCQGAKILVNTLYALIPRALWKDKPNTEQLAMERVYRAGVAHRESAVSAKTRPVVDAYLIAGAPGVFFAMLLYGILAQSICNQAESLFGGYHFGCVIIFNSLFQNMWRGNTFEFLINNILYAYLLMSIIHWFMHITKILISNSHEDPAH